jgi:hypothetical protein
MVILRGMILKMGMMKKLSARHAAGELRAVGRQRKRLFRGFPEPRYLARALSERPTARKDELYARCGGRQRGDRRKLDQVPDTGSKDLIFDINKR